MTDRPAVSKADAARLDALLRQAGEAERAGDLARSAALGQEAWDALPEPKAGFDFYPQIIARGMLRKAVARRERGQIETWLRTTYETYADPGHDNHFVNMLEGAAWRAIGDDEAAYDISDKVYRRDGREGFAGDDLAHLEWYLKERARRRAG